MKPVPRYRSAHLAGLILLCTLRWGSAADLLYTFEQDAPRGPYADALGTDGFQDGTWRWDGTPGIEWERPIFGAASLRTDDLSPIALGALGDLGPEVTCCAAVRGVRPGVNTLFSNWNGRPEDGAMFIAFDPAGKYAGDGIFLRFHHWRKTASGLAELELVIPPVDDWGGETATHHLAVTYRRGTVTAYLDGHRLGETRSPSAEFDHLDLRGAAAPLLYGGMPGEHPFPLIGLSDDVAILSRALEGKELLALARRGAVAAALWPVDAGREASASSDPAAALLSDAEIHRLTSVDAGGSTDPRTEWTFEAARRQWKPMVRAVQHVGIPGYEWETGVLWDGGLLFGPLVRLEPAVKPLGDNQMHLSVAFGATPHFIDRAGTNHPAIRRTLDGGRLPIPTIETRDGALLWRETVFAHLLDRRPDEGMVPQPSDLLVTHMCWTVRNTGLTPISGRLWLYPSDTSHIRFGYKCGVDAELGAPLPYRLEQGLASAANRVRYAIPAPDRGTVRQHAEGPTPVGLNTPLRGAIEWAVELPPGEEAHLRVILPYAAVDATTGAKLLALDSAALLSETRAFWKQLVQRDGQIITPDPFINDYLAAVPAQMATQVAFHQFPPPGVWMYKTSPNNYELHWPCNAGKALPTFDFRGLKDINRQVLQGFIAMQTDAIRGLDRTRMGSGQQLRGEGYAQVKGFLGNYREWTANPLLLSHGMGMWALAGHYRITRDRAWLGEGPGSPLQAILDAFDWVSTQRRRTMREVDGQRVEHWGMLPAASAHDWLAGSTIFNDAFCIYGMTEVARMLGEIHHPRAAEMKAELNDYRACLRAAYAAARDRARPLPLPDGRALPFVPRIVQELNWERIDWTYTGYGPLRAGAWGTLDPHDPMVDQALAFVEAGFPRGAGPQLNASDIAIADANWADVSAPDAPRHWIWRHYVEYETMWPIGGPLFLARDDLPRYFEWLFNNLAVVLHHDWRVGVESLDGVPSCAPGDGERWQLIRRMFVNETGGWDGGEQELFLFQAIPRCWLRPGDRMSVRNMGTFFGGTVQLDMEMAPDADHVRADVKLALDVPPTRIRVRLRSGDGRPLRSATINGQPAEVLAGDVVMLPDEKSATCTLEGHFE